MLNVDDTNETSVRVSHFHCFVILVSRTIKIFTFLPHYLPVSIDEPSSWSHPHFYITYYASALRFKNRLLQCGDLSK